MVGQAISNFLGWFGREISNLLPGWSKTMFFGQPAARDFAFKADLKKPKTSLGKIHLPKSWLDQDEQGLKGFRRRRLAKVYLPADLTHVRHVKTPPANPRAQQAVLELELARSTPFTQDDVYWTFDPNVGAKNNTHEVKQWIMRKEDLLKLRDHLFRLGVTALEFRVEGSKAAAPLAEFRSATPKKYGFLKWVNVLCLLLICGLVGFLVLAPTFERQAHIENLENEVASLRAEALALRKKAEQEESQTGTFESFARYVEDRARLIDLLALATDELPDDIWLSGLTMKGNSATLAGVSQNSAAEFAVGLVEQNAFEHVELSGATARLGDGRERFELSLELKTPRQ